MSKRIFETFEGFLNLNKKSDDCLQSDAKIYFQKYELKCKENERDLKMNSLHNRWLDEPDY